MTHTPGPWKVAHARRGKLGQSTDEMTPFTMIQTDYHATGQIKNGSEAKLCELSSDETAFDIGVTNFQHRVSIEEAEANALLIAAAPDMYQALLDVAADFEDAADWKDAIVRLQSKARAAIAKAKGG